MSEDFNREASRLSQSFEYYAPLLKVRAFNPINSDGTMSPMVPLKLSSIQQMLNDSIVRQNQRTGKVRKIILKARRHQISTYVIARNFWHTHWHQASAAFCLTHHGETTTELFDMTKHFIDGMPSEVMFPTGKDSASGYSNSLLQSHMKVGTAGGASIGHGFAINKFHGSEVSRWPNAQEHLTGILQSVANVTGTEIILESVGGKRGGLWHQMWQAAVAKESVFEPIFFPWFAHDQYVELDTERYMDERSPEDMAYQRFYELNHQQMAWRNSKLREFVGDDQHLLFASMYPSIPDDAFIRFGGTFINVGLVRAARKANHTPMGPVIMGVDFGGGKDRSVKMLRRSRVAYGMDINKLKDPMQLAAWIGRCIDIDKPKAVFLDETGASVGAAIGSRLRELGFANVYGIQFGGAADEPDKYKNKRVEMWANMRDWYQAGCTVPDDERLEQDMVAPDELEPDAVGRLRLQSKQDMRKEGIASPDIGDALALTFAAPVSGDHQSAEIVTTEMLAHRAATSASKTAKHGKGLLRQTF